MKITYNEFLGKAWKQNHGGVLVCPTTLIIVEVAVAKMGSEAWCGTVSKAIITKVTSADKELKG